MNQNQLREYLFQKDLADQKEMDKLIRDAQPKKLNDDYKLKLYKEPIMTRDLIGPEYMAEQQLLDLSIDLQLQNMVKQANYAVDGKTPESMKSSVTEEMIADYKKEVMKPVEIGGVFHLYRPVELPPLVNPTPTPYPGGWTKISQVTYNRKLQDFIDDSETAENDLTRLQFYKEKLEEKFRLGSSSASTTYDEAGRTAFFTALTNDALEGFIRAGKLPSPPKKERNKTGFVKVLIDNEKSKFVSTTNLGSIKTELGDINNEIKECIRDLNAIQAEILIFKANFIHQADVDEENRLKEIEFDMKKRRYVQESLNEFNRMNQGKIQIARESNESDDDFLARLQRMGNIFVDPADIDKQIQTEILLKAKKNILELTSDYGKAESITRMLSLNERFQMNKAFPMIKKKYSEAFGLNNTRLSDTEISQFVKNEVESSQTLISPIEKIEEHKISTKLRQFKKPQLEAIIDELNRDDPSLLLKKGTIKEMVDELDSKDMYNAPKLRSLLKIPDVVTSVAPIMPVVPTSSTSSLSAESVYPTETAPSSVLADLIAAQTAQSSQTSSLLASVTKLISSLSTAQLAGPGPGPARAPTAPAQPAVTLTADQTEGLSEKDIAARKKHLEAVELNRSRPKLFDLSAPPTLKKKATPKKNVDIDTLKEPLSPTQAYNAKKAKEAAAKPEEAKLTPMQEAMLKRRKQVEPEESEKDDFDEPIIDSEPQKPTLRPKNFGKKKMEDEFDLLDFGPETTKSGEGLSGHGIKNHVLPSTVPFGKIALDLNKLFYQNVLSIKRHNGNKIIGHKNKRVSDNFVDIILKMFENKPITQSDLKNIKDEQMLYDNLIIQSGLHKLKKIPTNIEQTSEQMKNRLGLITGEIEAGNSNKSLLSELHELLFKMVRVHLISKNAAAAYYKNIKDTFFTL